MTSRISLVAVAIALSVPSVAAAQEPLRIESGLVAGAREGDLVVYRGIPYAAPPTGDLRWRPPASPAHWTGVRTAATFGLPCPQPNFPPAAFIKEWNEDCLTVNVWTPAAAHRSPLPVLVVIHGGGFVGGAGNDPAIDPAQLARAGLAVVTFNYRLGVFGFFAHPELSKESSTGVSGNYGLMDQVALLRWVQTNIAAFGGDPRNVTIEGCSAGGSSVLLLMVAPGANGLFARAIAESAGQVYSPVAHLRERRYGLEARETEGLELGPDIAALRALSARELLDRSKTHIDLLFAESPGYWPMVDGAVIPDEPWLLFESSRFARVPLIIGANSDEGTLFMYPPFLTIHTADEWRAHLDRLHPGAESIAQAEYGVAPGSDIRPMAIRWVNEWFFQSTARSVARAVSANGVPVFSYNFSYVPPVHPMSRETVGAFHSAELAYAFGHLTAVSPSRYGQADVVLANAMSGAWVKFARTGDPNAPGLPVWPKYSRSSDQLLDFGIEVRVISGFNARALDRVDSVFRLMRAPYRPRPGKN